jgi:hypothetical protein
MDIWFGSGGVLRLLRSEGMPEGTFMAGIWTGDRCMVVVPVGGIRLTALKNDRRVPGPKNGDVLPGDRSPGES